MIGREKSLALVEKGLAELARAGAKGAQATLHAGAEALTRFANNCIHQNVAEEDAALSLVAVMGKRLGAAGTNRLDKSGLAACARRAVDIARQSAPDAEFPGLAAAPPAPEVPEACDAATAAMAPAARARLVARAVKHAAGREVSASGKVANSRFELAVGNSAGTRQYAAGTAFSAACTAMISGAAGSEDWAASAAGRLEAELKSFGRAAVDTALRARDPKKVEPGEWAVILAPRAVSTLLDFLAYLGFEPQAHQEGRSCLAGRMGQQVVSELLTLRDDGLAAVGMPLPFDFEGVPRRPLALIEKGVARELPHGTRTAAKAGVPSTGHSLGLLSGIGGLPLHLFLEPGAASVEEMIAATPKGLLVNRFWYTNPAEPAKAVITGMTRDGVFRIEDGKLAGPVCNLRFTESVLEALSRVEAVGARLENVGGEWDSGITRCPALKLSAFRFTGTTEF